MSNQKITATSRKDEGKGASRRLRRSGQLPAIVYGGDAAPQNIQMDQEKVWVASQHEWFYSSIIDLEVDGEVQTVLLRDMQRHPYKQIIMHLDFQRVSANEAIRVSVPLRLVNAETSPAGKTAGVVLTQELNDVEVICLPGNLPEAIDVDLSKMEIGDTVHLSEVALPKGVELAVKLEGDHNPAVAVARHARVEAEPEAGEAAEAPDADVPASKQDDAEGEGAE